MNILSYQLGTIFSGDIINQFLKENHSKEAQRLARNYNFGFNPNKNYMLIRQQFRTRGPEQLGFMKINERNGYCA